MLRAKIYLKLHRQSYKASLFHQNQPEVVTFFIGAFQGMYVQTEGMSGGENIDATGFHGRNGFFGLSASVWIAGLAELKQADEVAKLRGKTVDEIKG